MITIVELSKKHLKFRVSLLNNEFVREYLNVDEIFTIESTIKWFVNKSKINRFDCVFMNDDIPIGMGGVSHIADDRGELYMYIKPDAQGKGLGYASLEVLCKYAFETLGLSQIYVHTFSNNIRANRLYEKFGFIRDANYYQEKVHNGKTLGRLLFTLDKK